MTGGRNPKEPMAIPKPLRLRERAAALQHKAGALMREADALLDEADQLHASADELEQEQASSNTAANSTLAQK